MARTWTDHCDKCGEHIASGTTRVIIETGPHRRLVRLPTFCFCPECVASFEAWLDEKQAERDAAMGAVPEGDQGEE